MKKKQAETYLVEVERNEHTGVVESEHWFDADTRLAHRSNGPAEITFLEIEGRALRRETYYQHGHIAREDDLPTVVVVDLATGVECYYEWCSNNEIHRSEDMPAIIEINPETRIVVREEYWEHDQRHRWSGPAITERHAGTGKIFREVFIQEGVTVERKENPGSELN